MLHWRYAIRQIRAHRTDVHELLGADIVSAEKEGLVIVVEQLEKLRLVLQSNRISAARDEELADSHGLRL